MKAAFNAISILAVIACGAIPAAATQVLQGVSPDPLGELNALYTKICKWTDGETLPNTVVNFTDDGLDDYLITYDVTCRGQKNAFSGNLGMARQIWVSTNDQWVRILDANTRDLDIETRDGTPFVILQHAGGYCMTADAAPCFLTLEFKDNGLVWAKDQHPSMNNRLRLQQEDQNND